MEWGAPVTPCASREKGRCENWLEVRLRGTPAPGWTTEPSPTGVAHPRARVCHAGMYARMYEHTPCGGTNRRHDEMPAVLAEGGWVTGVPFPAIWYKGHILPLVTATQWG